MLTPSQSSYKKKLQHIRRTTKQETLKPVKHIKSFISLDKKVYPPDEVVHLFGKGLYIIQSILDNPMKECLWLRVYAYN